MAVDNETMIGHNTKSNTVSLEILAKMTGFPLELIKEEIFAGKVQSEVSLEELRTAMLSYIDSTILVGES